MRKFKNKKKFTIIVAFLMVFVMAGAFASFQALLEIRARVNLYTPTVDAVFASFSLAPRYMDGTTVRGAWAGAPFNIPAVAARAAAPGTLPTSVTTIGAQMATAMSAPSAPTDDFDGGTGAWSFNWGATGRAFPTIAGLNEGTLALPPRDYQTIYLQVAFDNFGQSVEFDFSLGNVGPVPLEIETVVIEPVAVAGLAAWAYNDDTAGIEARIISEWTNFVTIGGMFDQVFAIGAYEETAAPRTAAGGAVHAAHGDSNAFGAPFLGQYAATDNTQRFGLEGFIMPPVQPTPNTLNRSPLTNIRFYVTEAQWEAWADTLTDAELDAAEITSRDMTFRITYTVIPRI